jgi:voltage-gated potassium channel
VARRWLREGVTFRQNEDEEDEASRIVLPSRGLNPAWQIGFRILIAVGALLVTAVIVYLERDCYDDNGVLGDITFIDALYYATVSLSTTGYGDIAPVCESARLVNVLVITPLRFVFLIVLIGTTVEVLTKRTRAELRRRAWRRKVNDHTVIIGFGVKGRSAASMLLENGVPADEIVVVARDREPIDDAKRMGIVGVLGDGRRADVLREAATERAKQIIIATNEDDTTVLVTLTVRRLNPSANIVCAVREAANTDILRQSGADSIIPTAESAGNLMALTLISPEAGALMEDLLESRRGLEVVQRPITKEELGLAPSEIKGGKEIVLAVVRDGDVRKFNEDNLVRVLDKNDQLVVIREAQVRDGDNREQVLGPAGTYTSGD